MPGNGIIRDISALLAASWYSGDSRSKHEHTCTPLKASSCVPAYCVPIVM